MTLNTAIFRGPVIHERLRPKRHRLRYDVFTLLIDLDELTDLDQMGPLFGYNRRALLSFYDRDHGPATGAALRPWVEDRIREAGLEPDGGSIRLLCYPRVLGYVFNPLSVYFCYRRDGALHAILYEVCNTYDERHVYVIKAAGDDRAVIKQRCDKKLYVSHLSWKWRQLIISGWPAPADRLNIAIRQEDADGLLFAAAFRGSRTSPDATSHSQDA